MIDYIIQSNAKQAKVEFMGLVAESLCEKLENLKKSVIKKSTKQSVGNDMENYSDCAGSFDSEDSM